MLTHHHGQKAHSVSVGSGVVGVSVMLTEQEDTSSPQGSPVDFPASREDGPRSFSSIPIMTLDA